MSQVNLANGPSALPSIVASFKQKRATLSTPTSPMATNPTANLNRPVQIAPPVGASPLSSDAQSVRVSDHANSSTNSSSDTSRPALSVYGKYSRNMVTSDYGNRLKVDA